jgi:hypothetical protein
MASEPAISGTIVRHNRLAMESMLGAEHVIRALARIPEDERVRFTHCTALDWVPADLCVRCFEAVADDIDWPAERLVTTVSRVGAEMTVHRIWKLLLRFTSDEALIKRTPIMYGKTYNTGQLSTEFPFPGRAILRLTDWPNVHALHVVGLGAGIVRVLELAGRTDVRLTVDHLASGAVYNVRLGAETRPPPA